jgi:hypothetical protein
MPKQKVFILLLFIFAFRLLFGITSEFWFPDELQIYLLGLKWYTTGIWPAYGPDVVYTQTQIPGALQSILVGLPLFVWAKPEAPFVLLNILSFFSILLLVEYGYKLAPKLPKNWLYLLVFTLPWTLNYTTRICNPSYALLFSIPFFVAFLELIPAFSLQYFKSWLAALILGISTTCIMQLHLSYVLLVPFAGFSFLMYFLTYKQKVIAPITWYIIGLLIGASTLIPTLLHPDDTVKSVSSNVVINWKNIENFITILMRFLSFASYEIPYMLGGGTEERLLVLKDQLWMSPFAFTLLLTGFAQIALFVYSFFFLKSEQRFVWLKWILVATWIMLFLSFFFSIKGPSSHTFYILLPLPVWYSFYAYQFFLTKFPKAISYFKIMIVCSLFFHVGLAMYSFHTRSLYLDRGKVEKAIQEKNYKILGNRRADDWGYGY